MFKKKLAIPPIPQDPIEAGNAARLKDMKAVILKMLERDDITALSFACVTHDDSMIHGAVLTPPSWAAELLFNVSKMITTHR